MNHPIRILYVDDSALDRELVCDVLTKDKPCEYLLTEATSRMEFEARLTEREYDLVLSDFNILGFDGLHVLDRVRQVDPTLPVIIVTGTGNEEVAVEAMKRGAGDYIIKTTSHILHLPKTVRAVLEKKALEMERQQAMEALRQAHEQLAAIMREAPLAVVTLDLHGNVLTWNPTAERLIGWSEAEALGIPFPLASQGKTQEFNAILGQALSGEYLKSSEIRRQRRDGSWLDVGLHTAPLHDQFGKVSGLLVMMEDISERKKTEQALKESERKFRSVIEQSSDGIVLIDRRGKILEWNLSQEKITSQKREDVLGKFIWDVQLQFAQEELKTPARYEAVKKKILEGLEEGGTSWLLRSNVQEIRRSDGASRLVESNVYPIQMEGELIFGSISRDITRRKRAETALRESEERYRTTLASIGDAVITTDPQSRIIYLNRIAEQLTGWTSREVVGLPLDSVFSIIHEETRAPVENPVRRVLLDGAVVAMSNHIALISRDGREIPIEDSGAPIMNAAGKAIGVVMVFHDVGEKRKAEQALRVSEAKYRTLVDNIPQKIFSKDRNSVFLSCNENLAQELGITPDEIIGKTDYDFSTKEIADKYRADDLRIMELGKTEVIEEKSKLTGQETWIQTLKTPIREKDGAITGILGIFFDITERKQAEETLRESEERFRALTHSFHDAIIISDHQQKMVFWNKGAEQLFQYSDREVIGQSPSILISETSRVEQTLSVEQDKATDIPQARIDSIEGVALRKDGSQFPVEISTSSWGKGSGRFTGSIIRDITRRKEAEDVIKAEQLRSQAILEAIAMPMIISRLSDSKVMYANQALAQIGNIDLKILVGGRTVDYFVEPDDREKVVKILRQYGSVNDFETQLRRGDGSCYWALLSSRIINYQNETCVLSTYVDITERKRIEEALSQSERRLALHVEKTPLAVIEFDIYHRIIKWNPAAEKIFGYSADEIIGNHISILIPESEKARVEQVLMGLERLKGGYQSTSENITRDGRVIYCDWYNTSLVTQDGKLIGIASMVQDITEPVRDRMELIQYRDHLEELVKERTAKLSESEAELRKYSEEISDLYNKAPCGYHSIGDDGTFLSINDTELEWLGYARDEIVGKKNFGELLSPKYLDRFRDDFIAFKQIGRIHDAELELIRKDGSELPVLINATALKDADGKFIMSRETLIDNSQRQLAEKAMLESKEAAESANRAKSVFLANMSHEIRTPMNAILGFAQLMLRDAGFSPSQRQHLETINRSGEHLLDLINDILEMSKIEAGRTILNTTPFDLIELIHDLETMFRVRTDGKGLDFQVIVLGDLPRHVVTDGNKLRQIFINLLGNAVKFTDQGSITWRNSVETLSNGSLHLISEVEDTGPGIAQEEMSKLFQVFGQTTAGEMKGGGTGLGLAISTKFAQLMGGDVTVSSQVGMGSIFRVDLEIQEVNNEKADLQQHHRQVIRLRPDEIPCRILVADDHPENRLFALELLQTVGFAVYEAANGIEAVQAFKQREPHLILMDIHMPVMDGYEAIRQIKATDRGSLVPIIALTANAFKEDEKKAFDAGADAYMRKPLKDFELFAAIEKHLGVHYEYEEEDMPAQPRGFSNDGPISANDLDELAQELIDSIRHAALTANLGRLLHLIDQVEQLSPVLAGQLRQMANNYQYDQLLALIPDVKVGL